MDKSLQALRETLKRIINQLKPQSNALSLVLLTGRNHQGKSTLLRQSHFEHTSVDADRNAEIYYNQQGIIIELGEPWLNQSKNLLQYTLKQINRCHRSLKISGIILCIDINELLATEPLQLSERSRAHTHLLTRFGSSLGYRVDTTIIFTKLDALAGFCEFFQNEHASDLKNPLGFSLAWAARQGTLVSNYKTQFEQFIEVMGQKVIHKMHPARSSVKRTLIREFPLQLASLGKAIYVLIHSIPTTFLRIQALYFTSGEQGGVSIDRLNKKIEREYALTVQDKFPQSINHRAYFIEGALSAFQIQTQRHAHFKNLTPNKWLIGGIASTIALSIVWIGEQYVKSSRSLDAVGKELLAYDTLANQQTPDTSALYHLSKASSTLNKFQSNGLYLPMVHQLKTQLNLHTKQHLQSNFLPTVLSEIEQIMLDTHQSPVAQYNALKIYLMLGDPTKFSQKEVLGWFETQGQSNSSHEQLQKKLVLLKQTLLQPLQAIAINRQLVSDVRNQLNALPVSYLYYTLAKHNFTQEQQDIAIDGFALSNKAIPQLFTKSGFQQTIGKLPGIGAQLQNETWVLARQDLNDVPKLIQQAYCYEYSAWWQNFMRRSLPLAVKDYQQAHQLTQSLLQSDAIMKLVDLIQQQTSPEAGENFTLFNQEVAGKFTELNLASHSAVQDISSIMNELEKFIMTLSVVNDQGKTAFTVARSRFDGDNLPNPISALYARSNQFPEPVSTWVKKVADDIWFLLISDTRNYINQQWQQVVIQEYQNTIAKRFPFDASQTQDVSIADFDRFFAQHGVLNSFTDYYLKPFLDMSQPQWQLKELNNYVLPISADMVNELMRANIITNMFFPNQSETSKIEFSLQKLNLDPVVSGLELTIGNTRLSDSQDSESLTRFHWPQTNARLVLNSIEGNHYELAERGPWAFFKMLQKVNVLVDDKDSSNLQILFEINGNSGRYVLKADNQINPFIPGILNGFLLHDSIA